MCNLAPFFGAGDDKQLKDQSDLTKLVKKPRYNERSLDLDKYKGAGKGSNDAEESQQNNEIT